MPEEITNSSILHYISLHPWASVTLRASRLQSQHSCSDFMFRKEGYEHYVLTWYNGCSRELADSAPEALGGVGLRGDAEHVPLAVRQERGAAQGRGGVPARVGQPRAARAVVGDGAVAVHPGLNLAPRTSNPSLVRL